MTLGQRSGLAAETRFALVIGNDEYKSAKLATPANDAGLVAGVLTAAGFTVTGARNLDQPTLRESVREFLGQVAAAGPDAVAVIYLAGFGVQFAGENYYVPVDADLAHEVDVPLQAVRISDFAQPLAALPARVKIVILDAARQNPFASGGEPLASGLALVDPAPGIAIAFNAAPGTIGPEEPGPYGAYATALTEMIAAGGLSLNDVFARVRLRVSEVTNGGEVPWYAAQINDPFFFTERSTDAPPPATDAAPVADLRDKPMRSYSSIEDAYAAALALDTMDGYEQFLALYPRSRYARRVAAMVAVRREEIIWRHCVFYNTPPAYWSYLRRYPNGPHVWDARRRLAMIGAAVEGPPDFAFVDFGVPPPPPEELVVVDRPVVTFWASDYEPPPPPPVFFLPPRPREFVVLPPPPPSTERYFLPAPQVAVVPAFVRPPPTVVVQPVPAAAAPGPTPAALPAVLSRGSAQGAPGLHHGGAGGLGVLPAHSDRPPLPSPPASSAAVTPAPPPPASGSAPVPATVKPGTPPPPPPAAPAAIKPGPPPPPPHPATPAPAMVKPAAPPPLHPVAPVPAMVKPATPPPLPTPPSPHPAAAAPATIKPAAPPPPPPPSPHAPPPAPVAAKPVPPPPPGARAACPPGKTPAQVNGQSACK